jgi:hypothetical protein
MTNLCFRDVAVGSERIFQGSVGRAPRQSSNEAPKLLVYRHDTLNSRVWKTKKRLGEEKKKNPLLLLLLLRLLAAAQAKKR